MEMRLNFSQTKFMLFYPTINSDFMPDFQVEGEDFKTLDEIKLLGLVLSNDLKWKANTENMTKEAYKKLWMIKRMKLNGANFEDLTDVYVKQVRSILEFGTDFKPPLCRLQRFARSPIPYLTNLLHNRGTSK
jgi:hypothetical protein